jgi:demethylspheroidene O-methyltransferase
VLYRDLADPVAMLRAGQGAKLAAYWPYGDGDGEASDTYSELMAETQPMIADQVLRVYNFGQHAHILDIGGGAGAFLSAVGVAHAGVKLSLFDLPQVAVLGKDPRIAAHGGSFKTDHLPQGADCISLIRILHDHDDDVVKLLLKKVAAALPPGGTLVIAEPMAETRSAKAMGHGYFGLYLLAMGSGRPRTADEYHVLLKEAGFVSSREHKTPMPLICRVISARV